MTQNEKKAVIESMAERFMGIDDLEGKSMTIMIRQQVCNKDYDIYRTSFSK